MWITILLALTTLSPNSEINTFRSLYFSANCEDSTDKFLDHCNASNSTDAVVRAYRGCAIAMSAEYSFNPFTKLSRFTEGKDLIESAVAAKPTDPEIRFLRLGVQIFAPGFLNYNDQITADTKVIVGAITKNHWSASPDFNSKVIAFLLKHAPLSADEKALLNSQR
ncbi:MAG: hypothetical protein GC193_08195 [Cryomorphaceae bacterium]|nr:hypothetical protein [Cryomorphaceae bacterium]